MFSPIYLPLIKPVCSKSINLSKTVLNVLATTPDAILYTVFRRDIGLQFFNRWRGLLPLGRQVIIPSFGVTDSSPISYP